MNVTREQLRSFLINYHGFSEFYDLDAQSAVERVFGRLGSVQFDPLNVVGRNAELVLFSRNRNVTRQTFYDNLYTSRTLVDGWDKMMCIYQSAQFPQFAHVRENMKSYYEGVLSWRRQTDDCFANVDDVYAYIKENGPVLVTDIPSKKTSDGGWGPTKIAGVCCEYLYFCGKICVAYKKGVVKAFDISERLLGEKATAPSGFENEHDFLLWYIKRRIAAAGAAWNKKGGAWLGPFVEANEPRTQIIGELVERGELLPVELEDGKSSTYYICKGADKYFGDVDNSRAVLVAPLDNMIWDRKAVKDIFGFDYSWEVYVPAAKRKFGYYVLPVIIGNRFVGRLEPMQYKDGEPLTIKNMWYENDYTPRDGDIELIAAELRRLAAFLGVEAAKDIEDKLAIR